MLSTLRRALGSRSSVQKTRDRPCSLRVEAHRFPSFLPLVASSSTPQYEPESDSDSDSDSDDDLPRPESSDDNSSADDEFVDDEDGGSPRPRQRRRLDENGQVR